MAHAAPDNAEKFVDIKVRKRRRRRRSKEEEEEEEEEDCTFMIPWHVERGVGEERRSAVEDREIAKQQLRRRRRSERRRRRKRSRLGRVFEACRRVVFAMQTLFLIN